MRNRGMVFLLGLFLLGLPAAGFSENRPGAVTLSPFVGGYTFDGEQDLETSPVFGLRGGYNFTRHLGAELVFGYVLTESDVTDLEVDLYRYGVDALFHFMPEKIIVPYLAAGYGIVATDNPTLSMTDHSGAYNYGLGLKVFVADSVALRGDVRHVVIASDSLSNLEYTIGVTFLLGGEKRTVAAIRPMADTTAPTVTLAVPFNGNTDVSLYKKIRAAFSEAMDPSTITSKTFILRQGTTPVSGTVIASTGTTASFTQANSLLPGTLYTATITTGVKDLAGNPLAANYVWSFTTEPAPEARVPGKTIVIDKFVMLEDTHFDFDKATLTREGESMLKQNIQILKDNPKLKVRIAGYTSAQGTTEYNQRLSERRADTVMTYLIHEGGIAPNRLDTIGYGETRPLVYEEHPEEIRSKAAKANMRVIFEVIVK